MENIKNFKTQTFNLNGFNNPFVIKNKFNINSNQGLIHVFYGDNKEPVGNLNYFVYLDDESSYIYLASISVNPSLRSCGIGKHIITYLEKLAQINNIDHITAYMNISLKLNPSLDAVIKRKKFYENLGYSISKPKELSDIYILEKEKEKFLSSSCQQNIKFTPLKEKTKK